MSQYIPMAYTNLASHPKHMSLSSGKMTSEQSATKFVAKVHFHLVKHQPKQKGRKEQEKNLFTHLTVWDRRMRNVINTFWKDRFHMRVM